jgi:hypothetical protein
MAVTGDTKHRLSPRYALPLAAVGVLIAIFASYYFVYVKQHEASLDERAFRSLGAVSTQFDDVVATYGTAFSREIKQNDRGSTDKSVPNQKDKEDLRATLSSRGSQLTSIRECEPNEPTGVDFSATLVTVSGPAKLRLGKSRLCADLLFENALPPLITERLTQLFDDVLIATASGDVLYQTYHSGVVARNFDFLRMPPDGKDASAAKPKSEAPDAASNLHIVPIAGTIYRAYVVPVRVAAPNGNANTSQSLDLLLCGIVRQEHFAAQSRAVPLTALVSMVLTVLLVIVGAWPVLKFATMRRTEQITSRAGLIYSIFMSATLMLALLLVIHLRYGVSDPKTGTYMQDLATAIDTHVAHELHQALKTTEVFSDRSEMLLDARNIAGPETPVPCDDKSTRASLQRSDLLKYIGMQASPYPYFRRVFLYDNQGFEQLSWTIDATAPKPLRVCDRPYFVGVQRNELWKLNGPGLVKTYFRVDPIYSKSTGEYLAAIAVPYPVRSEPHVGVITMATPLMSLIGPVLPPDYGFAVIDPSGTVLFHSDQTRNSRENFFDELRDSRGMRAAVVARRPERRTEHYQGEDYDVLVTPLRSIQGCPWTLIVFSNLGVLGEKSLDRILLAALLCIIYFFTLILVASALRVSLSCDQLAWPTEERRGRYLHITIVLLLICVLSFTLSFHLSPVMLMITSIAVPVSAIAFCMLTLRNLNKAIRWGALVFGAGAAATVIASTLFRASLLHATFESLFQARPSGADWLNVLIIALIFAAYGTLGMESLTRYWSVLPTPLLRNVYPLACFMLLVVVAGIPCIAFFKLSFDYDETLATKRQQLLTLDALRRREARVIADYLSVNLSDREKTNGDVDKWLFLRRRLLAPQFDLYDTAFRARSAGQIISAHDSHPWPQWWTSFVKDEIPRHADSLIPLTSDDCIAGSQWQWNRSAENLLHIRAMSLRDSTSPCDRTRSDSNPRASNFAKNSSEILAIQKLVSHDPTFLVQDLTYTFDVLRPQDFLDRTGLLILGLLAAVFLSIRSSITNMFLLKWQLDEPDPGREKRATWNLSRWTTTTLQDAIKTNKNSILVGLPGTGKTAALADTAEDVEIVDVVSTIDGPLPWVSRKTVVVDHFEHLMSDPAALQWKLDLLERLLGSAERIIIVTTVDPVFFLNSTGDELTAEGENPLAAADLSRWARVLNKFQVYRLAGGKPTMAPQFYYRLLWSSCTWSEKVSLLGLAENCWPNHKNYEALHHLWNRGIVEMSPTFRLADHDFARFVSGNVTTPERRVWKLHDATGIWDGLRTMFIVLLLGGVAAVLFFSQKDTLGIVTGAVGALTAATKVIADLRGVGRAGGKDKAA